ncbi:MAG: citrate/2-methylcitrate synthase [Gracilibacteraceae bacterium]|jgi:citrate synthase|nr:citrate/2-methylcitrate synthase [Gracilibacteraceae bacterium]
MAQDLNLSEVTPEIRRLADVCAARIIDPDLYKRFEVNRGLRDLKGNGVLAGLTNICQVTAKRIEDGVEVPMEGKLYYQGIDIDELVAGFLKENRFGFEETIYLLLFGELPNVGELQKFHRLLNDYRWLPPSFTRDIIMKAPSRDMMNMLARSVLTLYYYDENPDDISVPNVLRQCLQLIARFPLLAVYSYHAYNHYHNGQSMIIHQPDPHLSIAENVLKILRPNQTYTELEARILDLSMVLHAEHGGGNNSTFAVRVVSSSATDTYSSMAAALGSLKGPKHGGANVAVVGMFEDMKKYVSNWQDEGQVADYLKKLLHKEAYDRAGLIYGVGHAIYSLSDPRALVFERFVEQLSKDTGRQDEYELYKLVARLAPEVIAVERQMYKGVSANIDFYSGFVYDMLGLPMELYTALFSLSRIAGWSAHRIEELVCGGKIIRPAYKSVSESKVYIPLSERS